MLRLLYNINTALYICISTILRYPRHTYPLSLLFIDTRNDAQIHLERKQKIIISQTVSVSFDADVKSHLFPLIKTDIVVFLFIMEKIVALLFLLYLISHAKRRIILEIQYLSCSVQECCILLLNRYAFYIQQYVSLQKTSLVINKEGQKL